MGKRKKWLVIVNLFTISRIIGSIFLFPIYFNFGAKVVSYILAFLFLTDWVDGFLARKFKVSTFFGSIMDTICDKTIAIVACGILCFINPYMLYLIIAEVVILIISALNLTQNNTAKSLYVGKIKMWVLSLSVIAGFFFCKPETTTLNLIVFIPAIIFELLTIYVYLARLLGSKIVLSHNKPKYKSAKEIKRMLFDPDFYEENKDKKGLLNNIYEEK